MIEPAQERRSILRLDENKIWRLRGKQDEFTP